MTRTITSIAICALLAGDLHAECALMPPLESSSHVRVLVSFGGKPLAGAKVIYRPGHNCTCATDALRGNPLDTSAIPSTHSRMTDEGGLADLPELAPGDYDVAATINDVASTVFVGIHVFDKKGVTALPMNLTGQVERIESVPVTRTVEAFRGIVKDPSGAVISGANFVIVTRGSQARNVVLRDKADAKGSFSAKLASGSYIGIFFSPGFRPAIEAFEVTETGASVFPVTLAPGGCP